MSGPVVSDWNKGERSEMISVGTHKLFLSASGTNRKAGEPVILLMPGLGSIIAEWVEVKKLVTPFARWIEYDRSGLGRSESPPEAPNVVSAASVAMELDVLLRNAGVEPPFVIVCHSWGGMTSGEFLHRRPKDIAGIIFVDANNEKSFDGGQWPRSYIEAVFKGLDWTQVSGLAADQVLSDADWQVIMDEQERPSHQITESAEMRDLAADASSLAAKKNFETLPLGDKPVSVITCHSHRDFQRMYDAGVAKGNGTEEERALCRKMLATWAQNDHDIHEEFLKLSTVGRHVYAKSSGHNVQVVEPALVAEEIQWVLSQIKK